LAFCKEKTDEELIREMMEDVGEYAEKKDMSSIMINLADDYQDFEGRGKKQTQDLINKYFDSYRGIAINVLSTRIEEIRSIEASIQTEVAFSSGVAKVFRKLVRYSTENYRLKIKLIKRDDKWKIQYAEWTYVTLKELFPESLSILKKIFPDL
jgi:ketosteroid isomerase-like protein